METKTIKFKPNYVVVPVITIVVALLGSWFTGVGMEWYDTEIIKPQLTPPRWAFPVAWNTIFICTTIAALIFWNKGKVEKKFLWIFPKKEIAPQYWWIVVLFIANAVLNVAWSLIFFTLQQIPPAFIEMLFLEATIIALIILIWNISRIASVLLLPYALWVGLASYLTYAIMTLNS